MAQAQQPQPLAATSVLSFHDAVELYLVLAGEHLQVNLPTQISFSQYWEKLTPGLPPNTQLPSKKAMERMNKLRVNLKHHGSVPSTTDITQVRADVLTFFTDATPLVFGGDFTRIDMIDLVNRQETVMFLQYAQTCVDKGDLLQAMAGLAIAFDELIDHYTEAGEGTYRPPFQFGQRLRNYRDESRRISGDRGVKKLSDLSAFVGFVKDISVQLASLTKVTQDIRRAMQVTGLGIDYTRHAQFEVVTPEILNYIDGHAEFLVEEGHKALTADDYHFARLFVIESALQAARVDEVLQRRRAHHAAGTPSPGVWKTGDTRNWEGPDPSGR
ncbi:hypothetical protein ACFWP7_09970 [Streptomyces sp. NPDC058470]|uniref:hypothetical protein n=1 Tax=Streptomyces sp. NPDC058470 TaxID=3346515 RepID=UPI003657D357